MAYNHQSMSLEFFSDQDPAEQLDDGQLRPAIKLIRSAQLMARHLRNLALLQIRYHPNTGFSLGKFADEMEEEISYLVLQDRLDDLNLRFASDPVASDMAFDSLRDPTQPVGLRVFNRAQGITLQTRIAYIPSHIPGVYISAATMTLNPQAILGERRLIGAKGIVIQDTQQVDFSQAYQLDR